MKRVSYTLALAELLMLLLIASGIGIYLQHRSDRQRILPGVEICLQIENYFELAQKTPPEKLKQYQQRVLTKLRQDLQDNGFDIAEITTPEPDLIIIHLQTDLEAQKQKAQRLCSWKRSQLHFRLVHEQNSILIARVADAYPDGLPLKLDEKYKHLCPRGYEYMTITEFQEGKKASIQAYFVKIRPEMDGKNIKKARPVRDEYNRRKIVFTFDAKGTRDFARVTEQNIGRQLAVVLDGKLLTAPTIQTAIQAGSGEITGQFSDGEAAEIAQALSCGSIPFRVKFQKRRDIFIRQ